LSPKTYNPKLRDKCIFFLRVAFMFYILLSHPRASADYERSNAARSLADVRVVGFENIYKQYIIFINFDIEISLAVKALKEICNILFLIQMFFFLLK